MYRNCGFLTRTGVSPALTRLYIHSVYIGSMYQSGMYPVVQPHCLHLPLLHRPSARESPPSRN